jgi:hypothetical protein
MVLNTEMIDLDKLVLDQENPRMPDARFANEAEALEYLAEIGGLDELVLSIANSGWLDFEPLIVLRPTNEVIEGNRRLAALKLLQNPALSKTLGVVVPAGLAPSTIPHQVRAWLVDDRREARDFIGFKHINGPFKWDSFAKAKFAAKWLDDDPDVDGVARRLGDTHRTVARLVNGYRVLLQAERLGFDREHIPSKRFAFSHLYTALTRPSYRGYLGLPETLDLLTENPVDERHHEALSRLMVWLFGQDSTPPVIRSQNPDLKRLGEVLSNKTAVAMLTADPRLDRAYNVVEDKSAVFAEALFSLSASATQALTHVSGYPGGDRELEEIAEGISKDCRTILLSMRTQTQERDGDSE